MDKKCLILLIVVLLVAGGGGFYGGTAYQKNKSSSQATSVEGVFSRGNMTDEEREAMRERMRSGGMPENMPGDFAARGGGFGRPISGGIIGVDDNSITLKLEDGSTRIVFLSGETQINKIDACTKDDLAENVEVTVSGTENDDGTIEARQIQISSP